MNFFHYFYFYEVVVIVLLKSIRESFDSLLYKQESGTVKAL